MYYLFVAHKSEYPFGWNNKTEQRDWKLIRKTPNHYVFQVIITYWHKKAKSPLSSGTTSLKLKQPNKTTINEISMEN